jgi:hypothetical protein
MSVQAGATRRWWRVEVKGAEPPLCEPDIFTIPIKKPREQDLTVDQQTSNAVHGALRCLGERAHSLRKTDFTVLRRYRGCPWRIGRIVAAALVLLHHDNHRTT